jgi:hypothetical protein
MASDVESRIAFRAHHPHNLVGHGLLLTLIWMQFYAAIEQLDDPTLRSKP